jgi:hypothetical protein
MDFQDPKSERIGRIKNQKSESKIRFPTMDFQDPKSEWIGRIKIKNLNQISDLRQWISRIKNLNGLGGSKIKNLRIKNHKIRIKNLNGRGDLPPAGAQCNIGTAARQCRSMIFYDDSIQHIAEARFQANDFMLQTDLNKQQIVQVM